MENPYADDPTRAEIWEMCVRRDLEAFLAADWNICAGDFQVEGFTGWDAHFTSDPSRWQIGFPTLRVYRDAWLADARRFSAKRWTPDARECLYRALTLARIEFGTDSALVHKRFDGVLHQVGGADQRLCWQSLFILRRTAGQWKQAGFVGYLPLVSWTSQPT
jgi:hypothetical protein